MKRLNFNTLKNMNVPEDWINNALDVPQKIGSKKHSKIIKISRVASVAACFVIVGAVALFTMPLHKDYGNSIKRPDIAPTTTPSSTSQNYTNSTNDGNRKKDNTNGTNSAFAPYDGTVGTTEGTGNNPAYSSYNHSETSTPNGNNTDRKNPSQIEGSTGWSNVFPFFPTITIPYDPTTPYDPTPYNPTTPYEPTSNTSVNPTSNTVPPATTATIATAPSHTIETQPSASYVSPTASTAYTDSTCVAPEDGRVVCKGVWSPAPSVSEGRDVIYCGIFKFGDSFNMLGDNDPYSDQHKAITKVDDIGNIVAEYYPKKKGITLDKGQYEFCFYNGYGEVLYRDNLYVYD